MSEFMDNMGQTLRGFVYDCQHLDDMALHYQTTDRPYLVYKAAIRQGRLRFALLWIILVMVVATTVIGVTYVVSLRTGV
jgi:hypothetical protein